MSKQFKNFLVKTLLLSVFFVIAFNIWDNFLNANWIEQNTSSKNNIQTQNTTKFKKINNSSIWKTWVAISTNVWIRYKQRQENPVTIYKDIFSISEILWNQDAANKELIWSNMTATDEYRNILKTNVKQLLDSSYDKPRILNAFIEQLEFRYVLWNKNIKKLSEQKTVFLKNMESVNTKIETLKSKIGKDFQNNDSVASLDNINKYLEYKKEYYYSRTYIIYITHFLDEYSRLSVYNKKLLDTLINNKDALIKDAFVVIPDSGADLLKSFNLLYNEKEIKK